MHLRKPWPTWAQNGALAVLLVVALSLSVAAVVHGRGAPVATAAVTQTPATAPPSTPDPAPVAAAVLAPAGVRALFLGDSIMTGSATPAAPGTMSELTAATLGWATTIDAAPGTGLTTGGSRGDAGTYLARVRGVTTPLDVVLLEGGASDVGLPGAAQALPAAVDDLVAAVRSAHPAARIVLMGVFSPLGAPVSADSRAMDDLLAAAATRLGLPFVSPVRDGWSAGQPASSTQPDGYHPTAAGEAYLAQRLSTALRALHLAPTLP